MFSDPAAGIYKKLFIAHGRLVGAVLFGDTADGLWYLDLIRAGSPVAHLRDDLVFGRALATPGDGERERALAAAAGGAHHLPLLRRGLRRAGAARRLRRRRIAGDPHHPANFGRLCSKGSALGETLGLDGRLLHPMLGSSTAASRASTGRSRSTASPTAFNASSSATGPTRSRSTSPASS